MSKFNIALVTSPLHDANAIRGVGYYTRHLLPALEHELAINPDYADMALSTESESHLIHYPFFDPFKPTLPPKTKPFIVTVHDLIPRQFKTHFPVGLRGELIWHLQKYRLRQADYLICPSHHARYQIAQILHYPPDRIYVISEAADKSFRSVANRSLLASVRKKYHLPPKFVLYVGDINWNKNIPNLVKACFKLKFPLVIVGKAATSPAPTHPWTRDIHWLQSQTNPLLTLTGFVPDEDLPAIFNLATIYCQPSYAEGFGLPLIQAMQSGTPTCFADNSSLPEISDYSGLSFDPYSPTDLKSKLKKLWTSPRLRQELRQAGLNRATHFSWQLAAIQTLAVYRLCQLHEK